MSFFGLYPGVGTVFLSGGKSQEGTLYSKLQHVVGVLEAHTLKGNFSC